MAKTKRKPVIKASALDKTINSAAEALNKAFDDAAKAVTTKAAEAKKLLAEVKRHARKKSALAKRKKTATNKQKKNPNAENRKALTSVTREIKANNTVLDKARASKAATATELAELKAALKRLTAYTKGITSADRVLNAPKKRRRKTAK